MLKKIILFLMEHYVKKYFKKIKPLLVVVVGSVGKTTTKIAIATVLGEKFRVRTQDGNHNMQLSVPPALLGIKYPEDPHSVKEWLQVLRAMRYRVYKEPKEVDIIVQELGSDKPGEIPYFGRYLTPDIAVVTAVSEEHMENFASIDDVAKEELSVAKYSKLTVINSDDIDTKYAGYAETTSIDTYGLNDHAEYRLVIQPASPLDGRIGKLISPEWGELPVTIEVVGDHMLKATAAAACVATKLGLSSEQIALGMSKIRAVKGRMNVLRGINGSTIIDDTYNSSPLAVKSALETLYAIDAPQRIAVLGSMNEMGAVSQALHESVGKLCDPMKLEWVVTIGEEANKYLAPSAAQRGCQVRSFQTPYQAGGFVNSVIRPDGVVLFKGSQNGVFAEEAIKVVLHSQADEELLVRQGEYWMKVKQEVFDRFKTN